MTPMDDLIARLEGGEGEDRRLDYEIFDAFARKEWANYWDPKVGHEYTTSLDRAVAFVERMLPGWKWGVRSFADQFKANAWFDDEGVQLYAFAKSPARALMAAALRALAQKDQDNG
jgi:hypothetical protein